MSVLRITILSISLLFVCGCFHKNPTIQSTVTETFGYNPVKSPRDYLLPGTVVRSSPSSTENFRTVCRQSLALGDQVNSNLLESDTLTAAWTRATEATFEVEASYLDQINGKFARNSVESINLNFSNAKVFEIDDATIEQLANTNDSLNICVNSILRRIDNNEIVTMIQSSLQADVVYTVNFKNETEAGLRAEVLRNLAPSLSVDVSVSGDNTLQGKSLIWGILDDGLLVRTLIALNGQTIDDKNFAYFSPSSGDQIEGLSREPLRLFGPGIVVVAVDEENPGS